MNIFVDENIPSITVEELRNMGHNVRDIRRENLAYPPFPFPSLAHLYLLTSPPTMGLQASFEETVRLLLFIFSEPESSSGLLNSRLLGLEAGAILR